MCQSCAKACTCPAHQLLHLLSVPGVLTADMTNACMAQERGVVAWSPQVWKRKVLLDSSTKPSEKPWYNAHLAITPVRPVRYCLAALVLDHHAHMVQ